MNMAAELLGLTTADMFWKIAEHIEAINGLLYEPTSKFMDQVPICVKQLELDVL